MANIHSQLQSCLEPVPQVGVPALVEEGQQLLRQVPRDASVVHDEQVRLLGRDVRGGDVLHLEIRNDAAFGPTVRDEAVLGVGAKILSEPVLSSALGTSHAGNLGSCSQFLVQKKSMSLTEQVLLHRDAQLLGMEIVSEPSALVQQLGVVDQSSASARPGELSDEFRKLFNLKQKPLFTLTGSSDAVRHLCLHQVCLWLLPSLLRRGSPKPLFQFRV